MHCYESVSSQAVARTCSLWHPVEEIAHAPYRSHGKIQCTCCHAVRAVRYHAAESSTSGAIQQHVSSHYFAAYPGMTGRHNRQANVPLAVHLLPLFPKSSCSLILTGRTAAALCCCCCCFVINRISSCFRFKTADCFEDSLLL